MTPSESDELLSDALELYPRDPDTAVACFAKLAKAAVGPAWAQAYVALARHEFGHANYQVAAEHTRQVLDADPSLIGHGIRGVAGILHSSALEMTEQPVDELLLAASIEAAIADGQLYDAATGLSHRGRLMLTQNDRKAARVFLERALDLFDQAGSMTGGPATLKRLAEIEIEEGNLEAARRHLDRGLARLASFPFGAKNVRFLEDKLRKLREQLGE